MDALAVALVIAVPFAVLGGALWAVHRWGRRNDPMSDATGAPWHTTGMPRRFPDDER